MFKKIIRGVLELFITTVIILALSALLAYILSIYKNVNFKDALSWIGLIVAILGGLSLLRGSPIGGQMINIGVDQAGAGSQQYNNYANMEATRMERKITKYWDNTKNHALLQITNRRLNTLLGGIVVFIISFFI